MNESKLCQEWNSDGRGEQGKPRKCLIGEAMTKMLALSNTVKTQASISGSCCQQQILLIAGHFGEAALTL